MSVVNSQNIDLERRVKETVVELLRGLNWTNRLRFLTGSTDDSIEFMTAMDLTDGYNIYSRHLPEPTIDLPEQITVIVRTDKNTIKLSAKKGILGAHSNFTKHKAPILIITPDDSAPAVLLETRGRVVHWASFTMVDQAIVEMLSNPHYLVTDIEKSLLRNLMTLIRDENLADPSGLWNSHDVVIVANSNGRFIYDSLMLQAACRPSGSFGHAERIGFYRRGKIETVFPKILETFENVHLREGVNKELLGHFAEWVIDQNPHWSGERCRILRLSHPDSKDTLKIPYAIPNDLRSKSGQRMSFTRGHRFVSSEALKTAKTTSDLV